MSENTMKFHWLEVFRRRMEREWGGNSCKNSAPAFSRRDSRGVILAGASRLLLSERFADSNTVTEPTFGIIGVPDSLTVAEMGSSPRLIAFTMMSPLPVSRPAREKNFCWEGAEASDRK